MRRSSWLKRVVRSCVAAVVAVAVALACKDEAADAKAPGDVGDACAGPEECLDGACLWGRCRIPCKDYPTCANTNVAHSVHDRCVEAAKAADGQLDAAEQAACDARVEPLVHRAQTCLWPADVDVSQFFHGGCSLPDEMDCTSGTCGAGLTCDANALCRPACATDSDCVVGQKPYCAAGGCYDHDDKGYKLVGTDGGRVYSPDGALYADLHAGALDEECGCHLSVPDPLFDPAVTINWTYAGYGFELGCYRRSNDAKLDIDDPVGTTSVTGLYAGVTLPPGCTVADLGICSEDQCSADTELDEAAGTIHGTMASATRFYVMVTESVKATVAGTPLDCAGPPSFETQTTLSFGSAPPNQGLPTHLDCWPDPFAFVVAPLGSIADGTYDLADAATWQLLEVNVTIGDTLYGRDGSDGTEAGATGTVEIVNGPPAHARLKSVTLASSAAPGSKLEIASGLWFGGS